MKQENYRACMGKGLKGKTGLSKEERKLLFCTQSKLCSGKTKSEEEAKKICLNQPPPNPGTPGSPRKKRGGKVDYPALAACLASTLELAGLTTENVKEQLASAMAQCTATREKAGEKVDKRPITFKRFMKTCLKEELGGEEKPFIKTQREINICNKKWRAFKKAIESGTYPDLAGEVPAPKPPRYLPEGMLTPDFYKVYGSTGEKEPENR